MTYIAEVTSTNRLTKKATALLLGLKRPDGLWISVKGEEVILNGTGLNLFEKQFILLELDSLRLPLVIISAREKLIESLRNWSLKVAQLDSRDAEINLVRSSLEYQSTKLYQREEDLKRRDELQRRQEQQLQILLKLAQDKADAAERQNIALKAAWEHLHYREQQLKGSG